MPKFWEGGIGEIQKAEIPDEDIKSWVKTLLEGGIQAQEVHDILQRLNPRYVKGDPKVIDEVVDGLIEFFELEKSKDAKGDPVPKDLRRKLRMAINEIVLKDRK